MQVNGKNNFTWILNVYAVNCKIHFEIKRWTTVAYFFHRYKIVRFNSEQTILWKENHVDRKTNKGYVKYYYG